MNKKWLLAAAALLAVGLLFIACPTDDTTTPSGTTVNWVDFPDDEIIFAGIYAGAPYGGKVEKLGDGTYKVSVTITGQTAVMIAGPFEFTEYYSIAVNLPSDAAVKPEKMQIFATQADSNANGNAFNGGAHWASSKIFGEAGKATLAGELKWDTSAERILLGEGKKYYGINIDLFFAAGASGTYEFIIKELKGANGKLPADVYAPLKKVVSYRNEVNPGWQQEWHLINPDAQDPVVKARKAISGVDYWFVDESGITSTSKYVQVAMEFPEDALNKYYEITFSASAKAGTTDLLTADEIEKGTFVWNTDSWAKQTDVVTKVSDGVYKAKFQVTSLDKIGLFISKKSDGSEPFTDMTSYILKLNFAKSLTDN